MTALDDRTVTPDVTTGPIQGSRKAVRPTAKPMHPGTPKGKIESSLLEPSVMISPHEVNNDAVGVEKSSVLVCWAIIRSSLVGTTRTVQGLFGELMMTA